MDQARMEEAPGATGCGEVTKGPLISTVFSAGFPDQVQKCKFSRKSCVHCLEQLQEVGDLGRAIGKRSPSHPALVRIFW